MKKLYCFLVSILLSLVNATAAKDFTYTYEGQTLTYSTSTDTTCCVSYQSRSLKGEIVIPEAAVDTSGNNYIVTVIGASAFSGCSDLNSVSIPESVTEIGNWAFNGCSSLTTLTIPNSVTKIGTLAFSNCCSLTGLVIPNSVTEIGEYAFGGCSALISVTIGNSVTKISEYAFADCSGLTSIIIPESVNSIGAGSFLRCSGLTSVTIPNSVTSIGKNAFYGCSSLTSVTIPNSVTSISESAFYGCSSLTSVTIPNSVTSISTGAFCGCFSLTSVTIPNSVTEIGSSAFMSCSSLTSVTIPKSVTIIGGGAFYGCSALNYVTIPESVDSIKKKAFMGCDKLEKVFVDNLESWINIDFEDEFANPLHYGAKLVIGGKTSEVIEIPEEIDEIKDYAFAGLIGVNEVRIPETVKRIGEKAFEFCSSLKSVIIGKIKGTNSRSADRVEADKTIIASQAFANCEKLEYIAIGENVSEIGDSAFSKCEAIKTINVVNPNPPKLPDNAFESAVYNDAVLIVPEESLEKYKSADGWKSFYNTTGINGISSDDDIAVRVDGGNIIAPEGSEVFDLTGRRVAANNLRPGIYIVRTPSGKAVKVKN